MKLSTIFNGIDEMEFKDQLSALAHALNVVSKNIEHVRNPKKEQHLIETREMSILKDSVSKCSHKSLYSINDIKQHLGVDLSNTKIGLALKKLGFEALRVRMLDGVKTAYNLSFSPPTHNFK